MPIYEYQCKACSHRFDTLQKISESPLKDCPECNEPQLKKLLSAPSFRLKGSGWYETDFKRDNQRNLVDGEKPKVDKDKSPDKPVSETADKKDAKLAKKKGKGDQAA